MAIWVIAVVGVAPWQCFLLGGHPDDVAPSESPGSDRPQLCTNRTGCDDHVCDTANLTLATVCD
jgi:hypothetical protein